MAKYERSITLQADAHTVYNFVADVDNMPKYLPTTHSATLHDGHRVRVEGEAQGKHYVDEGYLHHEEEFKRLTWGAHDQGYSGWLDVESQADNMTKVTVGLNFTHEEEDNVGEERIKQGLEKALDAIRDHVTG